MMYQSKKKSSNPTYLHVKIPIVVLDYQPTILTNQIKKEGRKESPKWDSNTRPAAYEADALPTELLRRLSTIDTSTTLDIGSRTVQPERIFDIDIRFQTNSACNSYINRNIQLLYSP